MRTLMCSQLFHEKLFTSNKDTKIDVKKVSQVYLVAFLLIISHDLHQQVLFAH